MSSEADLFTSYYMRQAGSGYSNIYSSPAFQRGGGIGKKNEFRHITQYLILFHHILGSFLSGVFRAVIPIVKKSSIALGQELLRSGSNIVHDVWKTGDLAAAQKNRGKEFISKVSNRVSDQMFGSGYGNRFAVQYKQLKGSAHGNKTRKASKSKAVKGKKKTKKTKSSKKAKKTKKVKSTKKGKTAAKKKTKKTKTKQTIQDIFA